MKKQYFYDMNAYVHPGVIRRDDIAWQRRPRTFGVKPNAVPRKPSGWRWKKQQPQAIQVFRRVLQRCIQFNSDDLPF